MHIRRQPERFLGLRLELQMQGGQRRSETECPCRRGMPQRLAAAFGLKADLDEARASLAETIRLKSEINSLAALRACLPWLTNPRYWTLREETANVGLRRAGFPDE